MVARAGRFVRIAFALALLALPLAACGHVQVIGYGMDYDQGTGS